MMTHRSRLWLTPITLLSLALAAGGCPPSPALDDDSSATGGDGEVPRGDPVVERQLLWPHGPVPESAVEVRAEDLCPAEADASLAEARAAYRSGDLDAAAEDLRAILDRGDVPDDDGSVHLLLGVILAELDRLEAAVEVLSHDALRRGPLSGEANMVLGQCLEGLDRGDEARVAYAAVPVDSGRYDEARVRLAALTLDAGDPEQAMTDLLPLLADPAQLGSPRRARALVLLGRAYLARGAEDDTSRAYDCFLAAWRSFPTDEAADEAALEMAALADAVPAERHPTVLDELARAIAYHDRGHYTSAYELMEEIAGDLPADDPQVVCDAAYVRGRSLHKRKRYDDAGPFLDLAATACAGIDDDQAVYAIYNRAQGHLKRNRDQQAIDTFLLLPERFPTHSYADDGFMQAALVELDRDRPGAARALLTRLLDELPPGDMFAEAHWRLAWAAYREGDQATAVEHLGAIIEAPPGVRQRKEYLRARYWEAKMIGWPDGEGAVVHRDEDDPGVPADVPRAAHLLSDLAREHPMSYYGAMAHGRLATIDPGAAAEVAEVLSARRHALDGRARRAASWRVDRRFWDRPERDEAIALACAGLTGPAIGELNRARASATPWDWQTEQLIATIAAIAGDPFTSHNTIRVRFRSDHPEQISERSWAALHLAYPDDFAGEIRGAVAGKPLRPELFQGLVREESAFQTEIRSWAGAMGLSQLMWGTARLTARTMGIKGLRKADLADPTINLAIGATYLSMMLEQFGGNIPCAVAAYNAGPGAVERWLDARSGYPVDEWVEEIPYRETRSYVPRVIDSYQTYTYLDGDRVFVALPLHVPTR